MSPEQQGFLELCRELRALGASRVVEAGREAHFDRPPLTPAERKPAAPMRQATPEETQAALERQRQRELSRV